MSRSAPPVPTRYFEEHRAEELSAVRELFTPDARVLDLGAGTGFLAALMSSWGCDVSALDIRQAAAPSHFPVRISAGPLPFDDGEFELVLASHVIAHVRELNPWFAEIRRVTAKQGKCVFIVPTAQLRFWQFFTHYPARVRRIFSLIKESDEVSSSEQAPPLRRRILNTFVPPPLGVRGTAFHELLSFRRRAWSNLLSHYGFRIVSVVPSGIFYTPYLFFRFLGVRQRRALARILGSATIIIIAEPDGPVSRPERPRA